MAAPEPITRLADAPNTVEPEPFAGPDHPMRVVNREVAFDGGWSAERAAFVADLFNGMAAGWAAANSEERKVAPISDALARGPVAGCARWLELGSGTGAGTRVVAPRVASLVCCDLADDMLRHAPDIAPRLRADAARLPFADDAFDAVLMVNMLLFPAEVDRVLAPAGRVVWVNTLGDQTPIHLPPDDVAAALPGAWRGLTARAGSGLWAVLERDPRP